MTNEVKLAKMILEEAGYKVSPSPKTQDVWPFYMTKEELFSQRTVWVDRFGEIQVIKEMSLDYAANVLRFLRRRDDYFTFGGCNNSLNVALRKRFIDVLNNEDDYRPEHLILWPRDFADHDE